MPLLRQTCYALMNREASLLSHLSSLGSLSCMPRISAQSCGRSVIQFLCYRCVPKLRATALWVISVVAEVLVAEPASSVADGSAQKICLIAFHPSLFYLPCLFYFEGKLYHISICTACTFTFIEIRTENPLTQNSLLMEV